MTSLPIEDAYEVQRRVIAARVARGEQVVGYKVGCTSRAIRRQFGLTEPICGRVMTPYVFHGNTVLNWHDYVCCAVEPEFVLSIGKDLPNEIEDDRQLVEAIESVYARRAGLLGRQSAPGREEQDENQKQSGPR